jgi:osmoprotectant transport system ATP-binding protein
MIKVEAISKSFRGNPAVRHISFEANDKEILVLLGPSGCGKTTTLKMINRLIEPDTGSIFIDGKDIKDQKVEHLRMSIGFVMQHAGLFPHYTIHQNITVVPQLLRWDKKNTKNRVEQLLEKLHLPENILTRFPHELSGGQQQRVGIARALIADTPVLLMDEPFGALDNITKADIHAEFKSLEELKNKTILLVTHDVQEAFELGHRIAVLDKGQIVQIGTPKEMLYHPKNEFVQQFFFRNHLLLEYKTAKIKELSPFMSDYADFRSRLSILESDSVWNILQTLSIKSEHVDDYEAVTSAFNHYRKVQVL